MLHRCSRMVCRLLACVLAITGVPSLADVAQDAQELVESSGVHAGLFVHLGAGNGRFTEAMRVRDSVQVHALEADAERVHQLIIRRQVRLR